MSSHQLWEGNKIRGDFSILCFLLGNWYCFLGYLVNHKPQKSPTGGTDSVDTWIWCGKREQTLEHDWGLNSCFSTALFATLRGSYISCLILSLCVLSCSVLPNSLRPHGLQPARLPCPWGFSRQEYWSGLPCPPPGNLPNTGLRHCRWVFYCLSHQGSPVETGRSIIHDFQSLKNCSVKLSSDQR